MIKKLYYKLIPSSRKKSMATRFTRSTFGNICCFVLITAAGLFSMLPLIYAVVTSFKPIDELLIFPPTFFVRRPTTENYVALPTLLSSLSVPLSRYVFNSLFITVFTSILNIVFSAMAAFSLSKGTYKGRGIIFMIIQFALMFNAYTLSVPQYVIFSELHIVNTYWVYILPFIPSSMGVFLMKQYIDGYVPDALLEAAHIDGANWFQIFGRIIFPIVRPCVLTLVLFTFKDIWTTVPAGTVFSEQLKTLPTIMSTISAGGIARSGSAMAANVIIMIPTILVYVISQGSIKQTMGSAGIKG